jgi:hypothetical protein
MLSNFAFGILHKLIMQNVDVLISLGNQALGYRGIYPQKGFFFSLMLLKS